MKSPFPVRHAEIEGSWNGWAWSFDHADTVQPCGGDGCEGAEDSWWFNFQDGFDPIQLAACTKEKIAEVAKQQHFSKMQKKMAMETIHDLAKLTGTTVEGIYPKKPKKRKTRR